MSLYIAGGGDGKKKMQPAKRSLRIRALWRNLMFPSLTVWWARVSCSPPMIHLTGEQPQHELFTLESDKKGEWVEGWGSCQLQGRMSVNRDVGVGQQLGDRRGQMWQKLLTTLRPGAHNSSPATASDRRLSIARQILRLSNGSKPF